MTQEETNKDKGKGLTGLANLGNTCFLNSLAACLSHTYEFNDFLEKGTYKKRLKKKCESLILYEWDKLRELIWSEDCIISPGGFVTAVKKVARLKDRVLFTGYAQNDLTEFLNFVINCFHESINREVEMDITGTATSKKDKLAVKCYTMMKNYYNKEYSEILDLFYGIHVSKLEFQNNHFQSTSPEPFFSLDLPIPDKENVSLYDCLDEYTKTEELGEDNMVENEESKKKEVCTKKLMFFSLPKILIMSLKRFSNDGNKKLTIVDIPLATLDLEKYVIGYDKYNSIYELYGVCNHMGTSTGGHYTAYVKNKENKWYLFDDKNVAEFTGNIISEFSYCLFYRKKT